MKQAILNPQDGQILSNIQMNDPRWPSSEGWVKMSQRQNNVEIHYVHNTQTGQYGDFKIK